MTRAQDFLTGPVYDVNAHIERVRALWERYPLKGNEATNQHTIRLLSQVVKKLNTSPANHILETAYGVVDILFTREGIYDPFFYFTPDRSSPPVYFKDALHDLERCMGEPHRNHAVKVVSDALLEYFAKAPAGAYIEEDETASTVPFYQLVSNLPGWIMIALRAGLAYERGKAVFPRTNEQIMRNVFVVSGKPYDPEAKDVKLTYPQDCKLEGSALVRAYLHDTAFHALLVAPLPFRIPEATRFSGQWIIAPPNRGKTNLLLHQFTEDMKRPGSIILMDSKGDLIDSVRSLKLDKELVIIDPEPNLALNPLDIGTHSIELLEYIFSTLLDTQMTPLQKTLFHTVLLTCVKHIPNANLSTFREIVNNGPAAYDQYIKQLDEDDQRFFYVELPSPTYRDTKQQIQWRLRRLMFNDVFKSMFSAPKTKLRIGELMDAGKVVIINNSRALLGDEGSEFFGRFFVALVRAAAIQRSHRKDSEKLPCYFYIDECQTTIARDLNIASIIDECRSQKIALTLAHQRIKQITEANVLDALQNCAIRFANSDDDAPHLASGLRTTPEHLRNLPIGSFAVFARDTTKQAVTLKIPLVDLSKAPRMTREEEAALKSAMRERYCYEPQTSKAPEPLPIAPLAEPTPEPRKPIPAVDPGVLEKPTTEPAATTAEPPDVAVPNADKW